MDSLSNAQIDELAACYQQSGSDADFQELWDGWLKDYTRSLVANSSTRDAEEALHDLRVEVVLYSLKSWRPGRGKTYKTWLVDIWKRRALNMRRRGACQVAEVSLDVPLDGDAGETLGDLLPGSASDPSEQLAALEAVEGRLAEPPAGLSLISRVHWHVSRGLSHSDTAARLGITLKSVDNAMTRWRLKHEAFDSQLKRLLERGVSPRDAARWLGVSHQTVYQRMKALDQSV